MERKEGEKHREMKPGPICFITEDLQTEKEEAGALFTLAKTLMATT